MGFLFVRRLLCGMGLLVSLTAAAATRKPPAPPSELLPRSFKDVIERSVANGAYATLGIGVIDGKRHDTFYFGHRDGAGTKAADDTSQFEIGAVSEVFTGLLLAQAALEGRVHFSDRIDATLPAGFPFADARIGSITLMQLATQRSLLPTPVPNVFCADLDDPYADYASEDLLSLLAFAPATASADANYRYSVLNAGLLGHLLGRIYQQPLAAALVPEIFVPLGLHRTTFADTDTLLPGHSHAQARAHWHYGALAGAAGLRSSVPDLLQVLQDNLTPDASPLRAALLLARQAQTSGSADQPALGWNVRDGGGDGAPWPLVWRASRTAGFASFVGFRTDQQKAIVILGNSDEDVASLGMAWLDGIAPPPPPEGPAAVKLNQLADYPGLYRIGPDTNPIVRSEESGLSLQLPGEFPLRLRAVDRDVFISDSGARAVTFIRNIDVIDGFLLHAGGGNITAQRLSAHAPHLTRTPIGVDAGARDSLLGDYRVDDDTWMRVTSAGSGVSVQWTLSARRAMFAYAPDHFTDADGAVDMTVQRDPSGRVDKLMFELAGARRDAVPLRRTVTRSP